MLFIILYWTILLYSKCISINVQISIGRTTKDNQVDVDLSLEGPSFKISRRQGAIKLRNSGEFILINNGKRPMYVDSKPVMPNAKLKLHNNSVIEVCLAFQDVFVTSCSVQHIGHVTAFWQCNFEPKFPEIRSQRVIPMKSPYHWLSVPGNSEMMHFGIFSKMPYYLIEIQCFGPAFKTNLMISYMQVWNCFIYILNLWARQ